MNKSDLLFLIDIDGTLISTDGQAPRIMIRAVEQVVQRKVSFHYEDFIGRLDPLILASLLKRSGVPDHEKEHYLPLLIETYLELLQNELQPEHITVFDGVVDFLEHLRRNRIPYGLLTGNLQTGAMIKLKKAGLWDYFSIGAFADDGLTREALVPVARAKAEKYFQRPFPEQNIWIVGDSLNDIRCAKANHCHSLIVLTGKSNPKSLQEAQPDILLDNLKDISLIFNEIETLYK